MAGMQVCSSSSSPLLCPTLLLVVDDVARKQTTPAAFCLAFSPQAGLLIAGSGPRDQIRAW